MFVFESRLMEEFPYQFVQREINRGGEEVIDQQTHKK